MAMCKRVVQMGTDSAVYFTKLRSINSFSNSVSNRVEYRHLSQLVKRNGNRAFLVDTLALVRGMEAQGVPSKQAEAITAAITEVLNDSLENVAHSFSVMEQAAKLAEFQSYMKSSQVVWLLMLRIDFHGTTLKCCFLETGMKLDKVNGGQRLDLNLKEKLAFELLSSVDDFVRMIGCMGAGAIRALNSNQNAENHHLTNTNLTNKLDREIHALRAQLEAAKYDVIKYCIGTLVSISAVGLAVLRILL
ncbi:LOW QUALITY PROTEIN: uncharacterized protein LOC105643853 [Jatropha curcas]|uniref:LOW QUALITY PROTEIN: uncharacterized protein LOC105643853 n=1 Tax=Jatropha curcas TaxID=180498 RepID=UPI001895588B|nr:LOW QUALITY PROTEIN: uncharacterized protein LOC105643853 [Jatropha curcas]